MSDTQPQGVLRPLKRYVTDHNAEGLAVLSRALPEEVPFDPAAAAAGRPSVEVVYTSDSAPADVPDRQAASRSALQAGTVFTVPGGTVMSVVVLPPGAGSPMHRTVTLDYGVVLDGSVDMLLDGGERQTLGRGDVVVQRGTMHQWRNNSDSEPCRMLFVCHQAEPVRVGDRVLEQEFRRREEV